MSSASRLRNLSTDLTRAHQLRQELEEFAIKGPLKTEYEGQRKLFFELSDPADDAENESLLDWFLFDWFDENGQGAIDHFIALRSNIRPDDKHILQDWMDSINSVFEIRSIGKKNLSLQELDSNDQFSVTTIDPLDRTPFKRGQYLAARLLPLGNTFIFSGVQFIMPDKRYAIEALEMRRRVENLDSPEALEKAQQEQCAAFCEFFGCEELSVPHSELSATLGAFQHYLFEGWRDPQSGMTRAESFRAQFGRDLNVPEMPPLPEEIVGEGDVTILCDEFDGLVLLPNYNRFKEVFLSTSLDSEIPEWSEIVWSYIKDPAIPIVAFSRIAEEHPRRVEKVFRKLLDDKDFSIEHLYAVLLHYKQPVDGIEELSDDERLWDFFDGGLREDKAPPKTGVISPSRSKPTKAAATGRKQTRKPKPRAAKSHSATKAKGKSSSVTGRPSTGKKVSSTKKVAPKKAKASPRINGRAAAHVKAGSRKSAKKR